MMTLLIHSVLLKEEFPKAWKVRSGFGKMAVNTAGYTL